MRKGIAVLLLSAVAGCASTPADVETAPRQKASAVLDPSLLVPGSDKGSIRIIRDRGLSGAGMFVLIYIDGRHVANVDANRVLELQVPAGTKQLGLQVNDVTDPIAYQEIVVRPGSVYDYRVSSRGNGWTADWRLDRLN